MLRIDAVRAISPNTSPPRPGPHSGRIARRRGRRLRQARDSPLPLSMGSPRWQASPAARFTIISVRRKRCSSPSSLAATRNCSPATSRSPTIRCHLIHARTPSNGKTCTRPIDSTPCSGSSSDRCALRDESLRQRLVDIDRRATTATAERLAEVARRARHVVALPPDQIATLLHLVCRHPAGARRARGDRHRRTDGDLPAPGLGRLDPTVATTGDAATATTTTQRLRRQRCTPCSRSTTTSSSHPASGSTASRPAMRDRVPHVVEAGRSPDVGVGRRVRGHDGTQRGRRQSPASNGAWSLPASTT